jgi:hypothetical protein
MHGVVFHPYLPWVLLVGILVLIVAALFTRAGRFILIGFAIAICLALLAGCRPTDTKIVTETRPPIEIVKKFYVPIPKYLTEPCPIAEGNLVEVIDVAKARKKSLTNCNIDKAKIRDIEGTPVPPDAAP